MLRPGSTRKRRGDFPRRRHAAAFREGNLRNKQQRSRRLGGVCLGGWMNMKNCLTGYGGAETQRRKGPRSVLGQEGYADPGAGNSGPSQPALRNRTSSASGFWETNWKFNARERRFLGPCGSTKISSAGARFLRRCHICGQPRSPPIDRVRRFFALKT